MRNVCEKLLLRLYDLFGMLPFQSRNLKLGTVMQPDNVDTYSKKYQDCGQYSIPRQERFTQEKWWLHDNG